MDSIIDLAKEFRKRDPKKILGPIVGRVLSPLPDLQVSILSDQVVLSADKLYITEKLYKDTETVFLNGDLILDDITKSVNGELTMTKEILKKDEKVMLVPTENGQEFFIIDKVRKAK